MAFTKVKGCSENRFHAGISDQQIPVSLVNAGGSQSGIGDLVFVEIKQHLWCSAAPEKQWVLICLPSGALVLIGTKSLDQSVMHFNEPCIIVSAALILLSSNSICCQNGFWHRCAQKSVEYTYQ